MLESARTQKIVDSTFKELSNDVQFDNIPSSGSLEKLSRLRTVADTFVSVTDNRQPIKLHPKKKTMNKMLNELSNSVAYQLGALNSQKYDRAEDNQFGRRSLSGTWALQL